MHCKLFRLFLFLYFLTGAEIVHALDTREITRRINAATGAIPIVVILYMPIQLWQEGIPDTYYQGVSFATGFILSFASYWNAENPDIKKVTNSMVLLSSLPVATRYIVSGFQYTANTVRGFNVWFVYGVGIPRLVYFLVNGVL